MVMVRLRLDMPIHKTLVVPVKVGDRDSSRTSNLENHPLVRLNPTPRPLPISPPILLQDTSTARVTLYLTRIPHRQEMYGTCPRQASTRGHLHTVIPVTILTARRLPFLPPHRNEEVRESIASPRTRCAMEAPIIRRETCSLRILLVWGGIGRISIRTLPLRVAEEGKVTSTLRRPMVTLLHLPKATTEEVTAEHTLMKENMAAHLHLHPMPGARRLILAFGTILLAKCFPALR